MHLVELDRIQGVGHLDMRISSPLDLDRQARRTTINQPEAVVADVVVIMCFDVVQPTVRCLKLPLNDQIGAAWPRRTGGVIGGIFGLK